MKCRALIVPRAQAETVRRRLRDNGWLRMDTGLLRDANFVIFPLVDAARPAPLEGVVAERDFPELEHHPSGGYRESLRDLPTEVRARLPRAFDVVGDIVLVRLSNDVLPWKERIGAALLEFVPGARLVGWDRGVHGIERRRTLVPLAGEGAFRTRCRENGLELDVDLDRAYYSPRLSTEHARVAGAVRPGETVFDLCCGIGPFALTIARDGRASSVVAVDLNPAAIELLIENARRLGVAGRIRPLVADVEAFLADSGTADRVILNLPHEGIKYLASVANRVGPAGTLHYYELMDRDSQPTRPESILRLLGSPGDWRVDSVRTIHPYSPTSDLVGVTLRRGPWSS